MKNLSFWAQSLDNESPDFIYRNGEELSNDELRQHFVSEIYEFPARKLESLPSGSSISIRYSDPKFVTTFALAKYLHFTTLCGLLGAREVTVEQIEVKTTKGKQVFKGSLGSVYVGGNVDGESNTVEEIRNNIKIKSKFDGGEPNLDEAEEHLRKYQLLNDISMKSLIDQRRGNNPIKSRELTLSLSEESKKNLRVVSDIKVPVYADIQAQIEQVKKEAYEFTLTVRVEF